MGIFSKFNDIYDVKRLREEVKEVAQQAKERSEKPKPGIYPVFVKSMEYKESKDGKPMLAIQLKVLEGECKNKVLFANFALTSRYPIHHASEFLRSLGSGIEVDFLDFDQYEEVIADIYQWTVDNEADYDVEYSIRDGKYDDYKVIGVFTK